MRNHSYSRSPANRAIQPGDRPLPYLRANTFCRINNMPFPIDPRSFGIGFLIGILFWILVGRIRPAFKEWRQGVAERREDVRAQRASGIEQMAPVAD